MTINHKQETEIRNIIHLLIKLWPGDSTQISDELAKYMSDSFRYCTAFEAMPNSTEQSPVVISGSNKDSARTILNGVGATYDPVLVSFIRYGDKWLLDSITSLCTGCMGNGYLDVGEDSEVCPVCGGLGWGMLDCTP